MDWNDLRGRVARSVTLRDHDRARSILRRVATSYLLVVVVGIVIGLQVAPAAIPFAAQETTGTVAVIPLSGSITGSSAASVVAELQRARHDPEIDAVVLFINSPGGTATASETLYMQIKKTAAEMPVVAYADAMAASGAYYAAVGADYIMTKPAAQVGSVGVIFVPPAQLEPLDLYVTTGPNKLTGADEREWLYKTENIQNAFVSAVENSRGENLTIPIERVAEAELFTGAQAVQYGVADEIGGVEDAVAEAASRAGYSRYNAEFRFPEMAPEFLVRTNYLAARAPNKSMRSPVYFLGNRTRYANFLMLPPGLVQAAIVERAQRRAAGNGSALANATDGESDGSNPAVEPVPSAAIALPSAMGPPSAMELPSSMDPPSAMGPPAEVSPRGPA